jgi:hypothetical protein
MKSKIFWIGVFGLMAGLGCGKVPATNPYDRAADSDPPTSPAVSIAEGADTNSVTVTLSISAVEAAEMIISNDPGFGEVEWESYATSKDWELLPGDGLKTVYAKFRDLAGNVSDRGETNILLDTKAPEGTLTIDGNSEFSTAGDGAVLLSLSLFDGEGSGVDKVLVSNNGIDYSEYDFNPSLGWYLDTAAEGEKTVYVRFRDRAGNASAEAAEVSVYWDAAAPVPLAFSIDSGGAYTTSRFVTLNLSAQGADYVLVSGEPAFAEAQMYFYTEALSWLLPAEEGEKIVYVRFRDRAGNETEAYLEDSITVDTLPPTSPSIGIASGDHSGSTQLSLLLYATGAGEMMLSGSPDFSGASWVDYASTSVFTVSSGDGAKTVYAKFRDRAGNESAVVQASTILDSQAPTGAAIAINNGVDFTASVSVSLTLSAVGASEMSVYNKGEADSAVWQPFSPFVTFLLSAGDEAKTVYVRFRDEAENTSAPVSDQITLDTEPPTPPILSTVDTVTQANTGSVTIGTPSTDNIGLKHYEIRGGSSSPDWTEVGTGLSHSVSLLSNEPNLIRVRGVDNAGNIGSEDQVTITQDGINPTAPVILTADQVVNAGIFTLDLLTASQDANFSHYELKGGVSYPDWTTSGATSAFPYSLGQDAANVLCLRGRDRAGRAGAEDCVTIIEDSAPPSAPILEPDSAVAMGDTVEVFLRERSQDAHLDHYEIRGGAASDFTPLCPSATELCFGENVDPTRFVYQDGVTVGNVLAISFKLNQNTENVLSARAIDRAGNIGNSDSVVVSEISRTVVGKTARQEGNADLHGDRMVFTRLEDDSNPFDDYEDVFLAEPGEDGEFGTSDDREVILPSVSEDEKRQINPRVFRDFAVWEDWRNIANGKEIYARGAGPDHVFGNADDYAEMNLTSGTTDHCINPDLFADALVYQRQTGMNDSDIILYLAGSDGRFGTGDDAVINPAPANPDDYEDTYPSIFSQTIIYSRKNVPLNEFSLRVWEAGPDGKWNTADDNHQEIERDTGGKQVYAPFDAYTPEGLNVIAYLKDDSLWLMEAGANRRFEPTDTKKQINLGTGIVPYQFELGRGRILAGDYATLYLVEAGPGGIFAEDGPVTVIDTPQVETPEGIYGSRLLFWSFIEGNMNIYHQNLATRKWLHVGPGRDQDPRMEEGFAAFVDGSLSGGEGHAVICRFADQMEYILPEEFDRAPATAGEKLAALNDLEGGAAEIWVLEPGGDLILGTADDVKTPVPDSSHAIGGLDLAEDTVIWLDEGAGGGLHNVRGYHAGADKLFFTPGDNCLVNVTTDMFPFFRTHPRISVQAYPSVSTHTIIWANAAFMGPPNFSIWEPDADGMCDPAPPGIARTIGSADSFDIQQGRIVYVDTNSSQIMLLGAGPDGKFATSADDILKQISYLPSGTDYPPVTRIFGGLVAWIDRRYPHGEIYLHRLADGAEERVSRGVFDKKELGIGAGGLIWSDQQLGYYDIWIYRGFD